MPRHPLFRGAGRTRVRRGLAASVATLALVSLSACGGGGDDEASDDPTTTSSSTAAADEPTPTDSEETPGAFSAAEGEEVSAEEFVELFRTAYEQGTTAHLKMATGGAGAMAMEGDVDYSADPLKMSMEMEVAGQRITYVMVDNVIYMQMPAMGDKFIKMDLDDPNNPLGGSLADQMDPKAMFEVFEKGVQQATYVGEEDVDGEPLDHYSVVIDTAAMTENLPSEAAGQVNLPETMTYEVYFDQDGFFRRMAVDMGAAAGTMTTDFTDWGQDVEIEAPPTSQVTTMPGM